jgi:hypothetical protein
MCSPRARRCTTISGLITEWIGTGQNEAISPTQLREALGQKTVNDLSRQAGTPQDDLLAQLSKYLPGVIDKRTPNGQLPNPADLRSDYRGIRDTSTDCGSTHRRRKATATWAGGARVGS